MHIFALTRDPNAVETEVQLAYRSIFPGGDSQFVPKAFGWARECFGGGHGDYLPIDARYHDLEHTMQGTLCMAKLLRGRHAAGTQPALTQHILELGLLAILFHDSGYLKHRDDTNGTGAKYTITHVTRSADFAAEFLKEKGYGPADILAVQNMIHCTGVDSLLHEIHFQSELERIVGYSLGTADLLGQMAAEDYVDKLPVLYAEFAEAARFTHDNTHFITTFSSADDLVRKTPIFWEKYVRAKLERDFAAVHRFLNHPYPDGPNAYLQRIEQNMQKLKEANGVAVRVS